VYAEFHPNPELHWLGITGEALCPSKGVLRHNLESIRDLETVDRIAAALGDLRHMYRDLAPEQPAVEAAIATGGLVLIEPEGAAYWEGTKIECDWSCHRKAWEMLWKLAANARLASPVNDVDLYGYPVSPSTMYNRWSRLRSILPPSLRGHVTPGVERTTYRLTIRINKIHLFDLRRAGG
jgi:hypothetical protein